MEENKRKILKWHVLIPTLKRKPYFQFSHTLFNNPIAIWQIFCLKFGLINAAKVNSFFTILSRRNLCKIFVTSGHQLMHQSQFFYWQNFEHSTFTNKLQKAGLNYGKLYGNHEKTLTHGKIWHIIFQLM
jgi:hypothetical protein